MPNHFSSIGFAIGQEELVDLVMDVVPLASSIRVADGVYLHWRDDSGAELWIQMSPDGQIIGVNPHFAGVSRLRIGLTARIERDQDNPLDGAYQAWADPGNPDYPDSGVYPFVFDCPDRCTYTNLAYPSVMAAQVSAFAHEVTLFPDVAAFQASQAEEPRWAEKSFVPAGMFEGEQEGGPGAYAFITGIVQRAQLRLNGHTGDCFWCGQLETLGGTYDMVLDPSLVDEQGMQAGMVIQGDFWLSGRLLA